MPQTARRKSARILRLATGSLSVVKSKKKRKRTGTPESPCKPRRRLNQDIEDQEILEARKVVFEYKHLEGTTSRHKDVLLLHQFSQDGQQLELCKTRRLYSVVTEDGIIPRIERRTSSDSENNSWTKIKASKLKNLDWVFTPIFGNEYMADCATLEYRFEIDKMFRKAIATHLACERIR